MVSVSNVNAPSLTTHVVYVPVAYGSILPVAQPRKVQPSREAVGKPVRELPAVIVLELKVVLPPLGSKVIMTDFSTGMADQWA